MHSESKPNIGHKCAGTSSYYLGHPTTILHCGMKRTIHSQLMRKQLSSSTCYNFDVMYSTAYIQKVTWCLVDDTAYIFGYKHTTYLCTVLFELIKPLLLRILYGAVSNLNKTSWKITPTPIQRKADRMHRDNQPERTTTKQLPKGRNEANTRSRFYRTEKQTSQKSTPKSGGSKYQSIYIWHIIETLMKLSMKEPNTGIHTLYTT